MSRIIRLALTAASLAVPLAAAAPAAAQFSACVDGLRAEAQERGVPGDVFDRVMRGVAPDPKIIELSEAQPEFVTPIWDYLASLVDAEKVAEGRKLLKTYDHVLQAAEKHYGVDRHTILAVWGVESDYGKLSGKWSLPQSLSTLACTAPRRRDYFRSEFMATLKIVARGDLAPEKLRGSWAGAFGHTQFMPSTYLRLAVDGDGDGRRDLVDSIPDALFSTANFLRNSGWQTGAPWGYEVRIPENYRGPSGRTSRHPLARWAKLGITRLDAKPLQGVGPAGLVLPAGAEGPAFLVFKNYDAAFSYNGATSYALAISLLSDRLKGLNGLKTPWPTTDGGLSRAEKREVQRLLLQRGYDVGEPDGAIGAKTRAAISDVQRRIGMPEDGRPGQRVLGALRGG
ncbi:MAG: lytic murein transglycosylase family protein [Hyphomicrobiales bacterium]|nr:lytic murein transglycosylase family protein [Hyphomicrobiales bacterium]